MDNNLGFILFSSFLMSFHLFVGDVTKSDETITFFVFFPLYTNKWCLSRPLSCIILKIRDIKSRQRLYCPWCLVNQSPCTSHCIVDRLHVNGVVIDCLRGNCIQRIDWIRIVDIRTWFLLSWVAKMVSQNDLRDH